TQPPQVPKCGQRGSTRSGEASSTSRVRASSKRRLRAVSSATTVSPGSAPAMKTALPSSRRATPRPSWLRSRIWIWKGVRSNRATWLGLQGGRGRPLSQIAGRRRPQRPARLPSTAGSAKMPPADKESAPMDPRDPASLPIVLLVEDDPISQAYLHAVLEALPVRVDAVSTAACAMARADGIRHDLWLIDLSLPDATGAELLAQLLLRWPQPQPPPALAHTADSDPRQRAAALDAGF